MDVTDKTQVDSVISEHAPSHIVHLAAQKDAPT